MSERTGPGRPPIPVEERRQVRSYRFHPDFIERMKKVLDGEKETDFVESAIEKEVSRREKHARQAKPRS